MKKKHLLSLALACMLSATQTMSGQKVSRDEWRKQIQAQETTINDYVEKKLKGSNQEGLLKEFYATVDHGDKLRMTDMPQLLDKYLKNHYRLKYFAENPGVLNLYNPGRVDLQAEKSSNATAPGTNPAANIRSVACFNGDFESDPSLSSYTGFRGPYYGGGECSFIPTGAVAYTPISLFTSPNEFQLTNNGPDPMIAGLNQTNNGSAHAMRINGPGPCAPSNGVNMLQRSFTTPTSGLYQISFSYALVMENPKGHPNLQPFFVARVLNGAGVEVGSRICRVSDLTNPIYNITGYRPNPTGCTTTDSLVWRDWTCASIQFQGDPTQTYSVEFFAVDCAAGGHFGYAYVDDICASECCPKFFMRDCCDMHGGSSSGATGKAAQSNRIVDEVLAEYDAKMKSKYNLPANPNAPDPCCNPCAYPNDPYPVFIMDEFNNLISSTDYVISWSHDPGNSSAYAYILPNQQTIITVKGPGSCVWTDTLKLDCCNDTIKITPFCTWDPCKFPTSPFPVRVLDQNGNTLTTAGGYTFFWQYGGNTSTGDAITATLADFPVIVTVKDSTCEYTDTLDINCCTAKTPVNLRCNQVAGGSQLSWDPVPGATYQVVLIVGDPACCGNTGTHPYVITWNVAGTNTVVPITTANCFSWYVVSICPDGSKSQQSVTMCSCNPVIPPCDPKQPDNLKCNTVHDGSQISWNPVPGATYQVVITVGDPDCCRNSGTFPYTMTWNVSGTDTIVPTSYGCFSWYVVSICPDGNKSPQSVTMCSCSPIIPCDPKQPENLKCNTLINGSHLSWDPVPGATYQVVITVGDPDCCGSTGTHPYTIVWNVAGTNTVVPVSVAACFSWYVISICPDGSSSPKSEKVCSCTRIAPCDPKQPENPKCNTLHTGSQLSWDPVPGAYYYKLVINMNDPKCCRSSNPGLSLVWNVYGTDTIVPATMGCFSWYVVTVCPDGAESQPSDLVCSCSPIIPCDPKKPENPKCNTVHGGSQLSWDPVPGAYYKLVMTINDPKCCRAVTRPYEITWIVFGTDTIVPASVGCFSWYVIAVCGDGSESQPSDLMCSCSPVFVPLCKDPYDLKCSSIQGGVQLAWGIPSGAGGYELEITYNDPNCCIAASVPYTVVIGLSTNSYFVAPGSFQCFSWRVRSKCNAGGYSNWVSAGCNTCPMLSTSPLARNASSDGTASGSAMGSKIRIEAVPNPASDYVDFKLYGIENMKDQVMEIAMYDITGREVSRKTVNADAKVKFDVYSLSPGLYIYKLTSKGELFHSGKIMIDRK